MDVGDSDWTEILHCIATMTTITSHCSVRAHLLRCLRDAVIDVALVEQQVLCDCLDWEVVL